MPTHDSASGERISESAKATASKRSVLSVLALAAVAAVAVAGWAWFKTAAPTPAPASAVAEPAPSVGVLPVTARGISQTFEFVGRARAIEKVEVRARVEGFLEKVLFRDGQDVRKGDLLYQIEKVQFQGLLDQAKANLAAAEATAADAKVEYARAVDLSKRNFGSVQHVDQAQASLGTANARVLQAKAAAVLAEANLDYTDIRSPIDGRIGRTVYTVGNLINPASGILTTIVSQDPIYVQFPVSVSRLDEIREARRRDGSDGNLSKVEIRIRLSNGHDYPHVGTWNFTDPQVNHQTDSLLMRGTIPNPERTLSDGQFVTAVIQERQEEMELVVPQSALQIDQIGYYALIVDGGHRVQQRRLTVGRKRESDIIVLSGLREGEHLIVEGIQKVRPGQVVRETVLPAAPGG
jgi:membrane fusion protein (multidrug efflux system)